MIVAIRHKGLRKLHEEGSAKGVEAIYTARIKRLLASLEAASCPEEMNLPGYKLHPLKGELKTYWAVSVAANWRIIFRFQGVNACDVDLVDYH